MVKVIWIALIILAIGYGFLLFKDFIKHRSQPENCSWTKVGLIGFVVNFFDVLGLGVCR